jgi:glucokinase
VKADGQLLSRIHAPTDARRGPAAVLASIEGAIASLAGELGELQAIGVACAGQIHSETGSVVYAPNLDWRDVPLAATLRRSFPVAVVVENDVRAAAWGEYRFGAGRGAASMLAVFVGTGVGSGAVLDGRLWRGASNAAGEIGHTQVVPDGLPCPCGRRGCLEQYASGSGFQRRFVEALGRGVRSRLTESTGGEPGRLTAPMVAEAAERGDELAGTLWADAARYLAMALANYVTLLNPDALILGGGVIASAPRLGETVATVVPGLTTILARGTLRIDSAQLGDWSGTIGVADLARAG